MAVIHVVVVAVVLALAGGGGAFVDLDLRSGGLVGQLLLENLDLLGCREELVFEGRVVWVSDAVDYFAKVVVVVGVVRQDVVELAGLFLTLL